MGVDETAQSTADEPRRDGERGHPLLRPAGTAKMVVGPVDEQALAAAEAEGYRRGVEAVKHAILDIDAHATGLGEDANGFVSGGYVISIGCLHRALGVVGHTAPKCRECQPESHECVDPSGGQP